MLLSESGAERTRARAHGQLVENIIIIIIIIAYFFFFSKFDWEGMYSFDWLISSLEHFFVLFCFLNFFFAWRMLFPMTDFTWGCRAEGNLKKKTKQKQNKKAQWRRSPSTTCSSSTPPTWTRFYAVSGSRTFRSARASRTPRQNPKVTHADWILRHRETSCPKLGHLIRKSDVNFAPNAVNYLQIMLKERPLWAFSCAPVRITHMAQVLCTANAVCPVLVVTHVLWLCTSSACVKWFELLWRTGLQHCILYLIQKTWKTQFCTHRAVVTEFKSDDSSLCVSDINQTVRIVLYSLIFLLSVLGNSLIIAVLVRNRRMRTVTNLFLLSLSVSDLMVSLVCIPFTLIPNLMRDFIFGTVICKLVMYFMGEWKDDSRLSELLAYCWY